MRNVAGWTAARTNAAGVAVVALVLLSSPAVAPARPAHRPRSVVYMADARLPNAARHRPRSYDVSGDGSYTLVRIAWQRYDRAVAIGRGTARVNTCRPSCIRGRVSGYAVRLRAFRVRTIGHRRFYTRLLITYGRRHPGRARSRLVNIAPLARAGTKGPCTASTKASSCSARALVAQLASAQTEQQRVAAITSMAGASALGVYDASGRRVVGGAESGPQDLYLYTFQVQSLADQIARGPADYSSFDQEAAVLNALGVTLNGGAVTGPALEAAVIDGLRSLPATPRNPVQQLGLIVRELGAVRHVDWNSPPPSSAPVLDPLQRLFILVDVARPLIHAGARAATAGDATRALGFKSAGAPIAHQAACDSNFTGPISGAAIAGRFIVGVFATGPGVGLQVVLDGVMGTAFAYSFHVYALDPSNNDTHFGHSGPGSGDPLYFHVKTEMLDDLSSTVINCGSLVGYTVPGKGPLSGVTINWDQDKLPSLGNVTCDSSCTNTNGSGVATLGYQPYDEYLPGQGAVVTTYGAVTAYAYPSKGNGNILGAVLEALGVSKFAVFAYSVAYHDPGGYRVEIPAITTQANSYNAQLTMTDTFYEEEACTVASAGAHVPGNPLRPVPNLGLTPAPPPSHWNEAEHSYTPGSPPVTSDDPNEASGSPAAIPMGGLGYDPPASGTTFGDSGNGDPGNTFGPLTMSGTWVFDSTGLKAVITATRKDATPGSQTFELPVSRATDCVGSS